MKKLLLSLATAVVAVMSVQAQNCTPNPQYADSTYGVWPDTIVNFPAASANQAYSTDLNFKVPAEVPASLAPNPSLVGAPINGFSVTSVDGLPTTYQYACNAANCSYAGGANGCANVYGPNATAGTYNITINVDVLVQVPFLGETSVPTSFTGYKIVVGTSGTIEQVINPILVSPNPATDVISVDGITASMKASKVEVTNVEGKVVASKAVANASNFNFDLSGMKAGIYFVNVTHASGVETVKFIKQ